MKGKTSALLTGVLIAATMAGCGDDSDPIEAGAPSPPPATNAPADSQASVSPAPSGASTAPPCVAGKWRATGATGRFGTASGRVSGGTGATMSVGADGSTELGFAGSEPLTFSAEAAGATVRGQALYSGSMHASVVFEPTGKGAGRWQPRDATENSLRVTVKLIEPFSVTLLDNAGLGQLTGGELPGPTDALDAMPVFRGGTYTCAADTLRIRTEQNGPDLAWTFTRAS
jgi:hypothetical protein